MMLRRILVFILFFFNDTATTEIYTLSLHDALPISLNTVHIVHPGNFGTFAGLLQHHALKEAGKCSEIAGMRSEEHTSELQSHLNLVCRLLLEKKNSARSSVRVTLTFAPIHMPDEST